MKNYFRIERLEKSARILWGLLLLTLPITTFPYFPGALGRTTIKPLALLPLALLVPLLLVIIWKRRKLSLPANTVPLLAFLIFALISTVLGYLLSPIELRGASYLDRAMRAWLSLFLGLLFFFSAYWMNRDREDLKHSLKWLYAGLAATLLWSLIQALAVNTDLLARASIDRFQLFISERGVQPRRVTGFAFEPAWLADQLVIFYMPWLFAALITRFSFQSRKWMEPLLFVLAIVVLLFTYSRGGMLGAAISIAVVSIVLGREFLAGMFAWLASPFRRAKNAERGKALFVRLLLITVIVLFALGTFSFLSQYNYFANLWNASRNQSLTNYLIEINTAQRLAYAVAGYGVFENHPLVGVGLGASGLYLFEEFPDWALAVPEIARQLSPDSNVIANAKNLFVRLLAETGLPGFIFFIAFSLSFLIMIRRQLGSGKAWLRYAATAGLFAWIGIMVRNLTQDSLTLPIMWVSLGMLAGLSPIDADK